MKQIIIAAALIIFAIAEVAATGLLYDRFGLSNLVLTYFVTTSVGALVLLSQSKTMSAIAKETSKRSKKDSLNHQLKAQLSGGEKTEEVQEWSVLIAQGAIYTFAWVLVLIPGLVTDFVGFGLVGIWFSRKERAASML